MRKLMKWSAIAASAFILSATPALSQDPDPFAEVPILSPTALRADAGDGRAYLRWNPMIEDQRVVAFRVHQLAPERRIVADGLDRTHHVATGLTNGETYRFSVVGVLEDGRATPHSNEVTITPAEVGVAKVERLRRGDTITVGRHEQVQLERNAVRVVFPDGQELTFSLFRPIDWKTAEGEHLIYPGRFGNGLDVGRFDERGVPRTVAANDGPAATTDGGGDREHGTPVPDHPQAGHPHATLIEPLTQRLPERGKPRVYWFDPEVDGRRVTFHYWQPMVLKSYGSQDYVLVWETWWPITRRRHGTTYRGLARLIEVRMPGAWDEGYSIMLNNGFGPDGGSREGVISYSSGFRRPSTEIVDFSGDRSRQVFFQSPRPPRQASYHPNQNCLQASPLIFLDWDRPGHRGTLTISARSLYYHCAHAASTYVEQGVDGVWPNFAWDLGASGERVTVDTVEYLYAHEPEQPLPQRYVNARMETLHHVSERMGVQDRLVSPVVGGTMGKVERDGGPAAHVKAHLADADRPVPAFQVFHDFWHAVPATVNPRLRWDPDHGVNRAIAELPRAARARGVERVGYWFRPEFIKTSILQLRSETMPTARTYYGYSLCKYPNVVEALAARGIPIGREHPEWIRRTYDGGWPTRTPYSWVPMSLATPWWDRVMWPTLRTSKAMGFDYVLMDGGFGGMAGVDYAPMLAGRRRTAVAAQPFWWRMFRTMHHLGVDCFGECTQGWIGGFANLTGPGDEHHLWMYHASSVWGNRDLNRPEHLHKLFQLYNGSQLSLSVKDPRVAAVCRYAADFFSQHPVPDRLEFQNLNAGEPREMEIDVVRSPVAGEARRISEEAKVTRTVYPWRWDAVTWHFGDGSTAVYPAYDQIDWEAVK